MKKTVYKWYKYDIKTDHKYGIVFGPSNISYGSPDHLYKSYAINQTWWNRIDLSNRVSDYEMAVGDVGYEMLHGDFQDRIYRYVKKDIGFECTGLGEAKIVSSSQSKGAYNSSVESTNEFAYPKSGILDGYWYEYIGSNK